MHPSLQTVEDLQTLDQTQLPDLKELARDTYRWMLYSRTLENKLASLYRAGGKILGGVYVGKGQEAFSASLGSVLRKGSDIFSPLIRDQAGRLAFGEPMLDATRTYLGSVKGPMRGRDGNIHRGRPREGMPAMISHLGVMISYVCGMLMGRRMQDKPMGIGATCIGDGATSTGSFHEAINLAAVEKLPLILSIANNQYAYSTPNEHQFACKHLIDKAIGYGIEGHQVDGTDLIACLRTFQKAYQRAKDGHGPQLVVGDLLRLSGHGEHDDASYVKEELKCSKLGQDCLELGKQALIQEGWSEEKEIAQWEEEGKIAVQEAVDVALSEEKPDPNTENWHAYSRKDLVDPYEMG